MYRTIVISDIHGCFLTLKKLLEKIEYHSTDQLLILGDLIDRGPRSKEVLDFFLEVQKIGSPVVLLRGNHEVMFLDALRDSALEARFIRAGGDATLRSFGVDKVHDVPMPYIHLIQKMWSHYEDEFGIYVHAGLNFLKANIFEDEEPMYWSREMTIDPVKTGGRPVIHGHTPTRLSVIEQMINSKSLNYRINVDNGCVFPGEGYNQLMAYFPKTNHFVVQKNCD